MPAINEELMRTNSFKPKKKEIVDSTKHDFDYEDVINYE